MKIHINNLNAKRVFLSVPCFKRRILEINTIASICFVSLLATEVEEQKPNPDELPYTPPPELQVPAGVQVVSIQQCGSVKGLRAPTILRLFI